MRNWLAVTLILVFAISASGLVWGLQQSNYDIGYSEGYTAGNSTGYQSGWVKGNQTGYQVGFKEDYISGYQSGLNQAPYIQEGQVPFNATELQNFKSIKNRLQVINTDPSFTGNRTLEWISMRNSTASPWDPYQKSMEYLCFWSGQGAKGEWEAVVSIYNSPGSLNQYVVEVSRFTWHSLQVTLDGHVKADFPQVTSDTTSLGYATFSAEP